MTVIVAFEGCKKQLNNIWKILICVNYSDLRNAYNKQRKYKIVANENVQKLLLVKNS